MPNEHAVTSFPLLYRESRYLAPLAFSRPPENQGKKCCVNKNLNAQVRVQISKKHCPCATGQPGNVGFQALHKTLGQGARTQGDRG